MSTSFGNDPEFNDIGPKMSSGSTFNPLKIVLAVIFIGFLVALFLPATRSVGPAARRTQCVNNLKQIGLALHNYVQAYHSLPPAYTVDADGRPLHSWRTLILPYLEQASLYETIDLSKPWDDPVNAKALGTTIPAYCCPQLAVSTRTKTTYLANAGPDGFLIPGRSRRFEEIADGLSSTLAVIEVDEQDAVPWMAPTDADASMVMKLDAKAKLSHSGGMNVLFGDGSVRFMRADMSAAMRRALLSIAGGDNDAIKEW